MIIRKNIFIWIVIVATVYSWYTQPCAQAFKQDGYVELCDQTHTAETFDDLYACFDELVDFLQANLAWVQKLYIAKERFIRSKDRNYYSTNFFGLYDESKITGRNQISFYYATHFHDFLFSFFPEFKQVPEFVKFFQMCYSIQQSYQAVYQQVAIDLGIEKIFSASSCCPAILFKVVKYLPAYAANRPHYDGSAFSLFLDSTDDQSLLLAVYESDLAVADFFVPARKFARSNYQKSMLVIPGTLLTDFLIYPTPHIVLHSGKVRYATIAFAMRPLEMKRHGVSAVNIFKELPSFR